jgi:hypothetical protein
LKLVCLTLPVSEQAKYLMDLGLVLQMQPGLAQAAYKSSGSDSLGRRAVEQMEPVVGLH